MPPVPVGVANLPAYREIISRVAFKSVTRVKNRRTRVYGTRRVIHAGRFINSY